MSTLKVSSIAHPSAASAAFTLNSDGTVTTGPGVNFGSFVAGTVMLFVQTSSPTGWTKSTTHDDKTLRVVSGSASSGGSTAFTSVFASRTPSGSVSGSNSGGSVNNTTLTATQMPSHLHYTLANVELNAGSAPTVGNQYVARRNVSSSFSVNYALAGTATGASEGYSSNTGGGGAHGHGFTDPSWSGSFTGSAMDFAVQYVDVIIATKD